MALLEDVFAGSAVTGVAIGVGALLLAPSVVPLVGRVLRPAAKAVIKGGLVLYRDTLAEIGEVASDLVAEARAEIEQSDSRAVSTEARSGRAARAEAH